MKIFFKNSRNATIFLFFISLIIRILILVAWDNNTISPDGIGYHTIAVNLVKGNGFSAQEKVPFEKYYFREPGYPVFLAGIYSIVNLFHPIQYIEKYDNKNYTLDKYYPEVVVAKIIQIILDSFGIILLFLIIMRISNIKTAFFTAFFTAIFFNLAFHSVFILRETLVMFLLLVLNFFYLKYIFEKNKIRWLLLMGTSIGLLIHIFQIHIFILPILFVLILLQSRNIKKSVIHTTIVALVTILITLPFSINVYKFYPDVRIFKTFGCSLTYELGRYTNAINKLQYYGIITTKEARNLQEWNKSSKEQFEKSFNGTYLSKVDSINLLVKEPLVSKRLMKMGFISFKKSFFHTKIGTYGGKEIINNNGYLIVIPLLIIPVLIGILGILGVLFYWKKYLIYFLPFIFYVSFFILLGSEYRRMIILQPFLIFFGLLFLNKIRKITMIHYKNHN